MGDERAGDADQVNPSDGASSLPSDGTPASRRKRPSDEESRKREADRARRRRLNDKLKSAKSEEEMLALMRKLSGAGVDVEEIAGEEAAQLAQPMTPQPTAAELQAKFVEGLAELGNLISFAAEKSLAPRAGMDATQLAQREDAKLIAQTIGECLKQEPGQKLASAWSPILARYMPAFITNPWVVAAVGTGQCGLMIAMSIDATLEKRDAERAAAKKSAAPA